MNEILYEDFDELYKIWASKNFQSKINTHACFETADEVLISQLDESIKPYFQRKCEDNETVNEDLLVAMVETLENVDTVLFYALEEGIKCGYKNYAKQDLKIGIELEIKINDTYVNLGLIFSDIIEKIMNLVPNHFNRKKSLRYKLMINFVCDNFRPLVYTFSELGFVLGYLLEKKNYKEEFDVCTIAKESDPIQAYSDSITRYGKVGTG